MNKNKYTTNKFEKVFRTNPFEKVFSKYEAKKSWIYKKMLNSLNSIRIHRRTAEVPDET